MAISAVPDLNLDGYSDVVVGAPLQENGKGVVYVYNGDKKTLNKQFSQVKQLWGWKKIKHIHQYLIFYRYFIKKIISSVVCMFIWQRIFGSKHDPLLQYFGRSLDSFNDLNDDTIPDVSVGAYGKVVQLWCVKDVNSTRNKYFGFTRNPYLIQNEWDNRFGETDDILKLNLISGPEEWEWLQLQLHSTQIKSIFSTNSVTSVDANISASRPPFVLQLHSDPRKLWGPLVILLFSDKKINYSRKVRVGVSSFSSLSKSSENMMLYFLLTFLFFVRMNQSVWLVLCNWRCWK